MLRLVGYAREHGHANPPVRTVWLDWKIGVWVRELRKKKRLGLLTAAQVEQAERLGTDWDPSAKWTPTNGATPPDSTTTTRSTIARQPRSTHPLLA